MSQLSGCASVLEVAKSVYIQTLLVIFLNPFLGIYVRKFNMLYLFFFYWLYSPLGPWLLIFSLMIIFTDGRTPWTSDQLVARPLPKHGTTQTHTPNIHVLCWIRTHDPGFRASEDSAYLRPLGYRDWRYIYLPT
jgi:hypothetical protein